MEHVELGDEIELVELCGRSCILKPGHGRGNVHRIFMATISAKLSEKSGSSHAGSNSMDLAEGVWDFGEPCCGTKWAWR